MLQAKIVQVAGLNLYAYGDLLQSEEEYLGELPNRQAASYLGAAKLIGAMAREAKVTPGKMIEALSAFEGNPAAMDSKEGQVILAHADELPSLIASMSSGQGNLVAEQVTFFVNSRIDPEWLASNAAAIALQMKLSAEKLTPVWTEEATKRLTRSAIAEVIAFINQETMGAAVGSGGEVVELETPQSLITVETSAELGN